jgi:hypothetical protein
MKIRIKREDVINAIKTEPLRGGQFFHGVGYAISTCDVCAVGAVLRQAFNKRNIDKELTNNTGFLATKNYTIGSEKNALADKNYLGALSCKFEDMCDKGAKRNGFTVVMSHSYNVTQSTRKSLVKWVKKNLPSYFMVEV